MRRDCQPCIVGEDGSYQSLTRLDLSDRSIREDFLQASLHTSPQILPVCELDQSFSPLVSLGREIQRIDNLFVTPSGRLVLVETKLWRNPESTREAVAQIMDYAQKLRGIRYEDLQSEARSAKDTPLTLDKTIHGLVSEQFPDETEDEADFIDSVNRTLHSARFMLLIVGDGIKENLEGLVDLIQTQPQLLFTFGLIELQLYKQISTNGYLVVPQIVAHSTEIVRAVVKVKTEGRAEVSVSIEPESREREGGKQRVKLDEVEFYEMIANSSLREGWRGIIEEAKEFGFELAFSSKSVSLCVPHPSKEGTPLHVFRMTTSGRAFPHAKIGNRSPKDKEARAVLMVMTSKMGTIFGIPCNPDKPILVKQPRANEVLGKRDEVLQILRDAFSEIEALKG